MYILLPSYNGYSKLPAPLQQKNSNETLSAIRHQVAEYILQYKTVTALELSIIFSLPLNQAQNCLSFWEGAGLIALYKTNATANQEITMEIIERVSNHDPLLKPLFNNIQKISGRMLVEKDMRLLFHLYIFDKYEYELILLAASNLHSQGQFKLLALQKLLQEWKSLNITTLEKAKQYVKNHNNRQQYEAEISSLFNKTAASLTLQEKKIIHKWVEIYEFDAKMIRLAQQTAKYNKNSITYISGILTNWFKAGYKHAFEVPPSLS